MRIREIGTFFQWLLVFLLLGAGALAGSSQSLVYQGRIVRPDSTAVNSGVVTFTLSVYSPSPKSCLLYSETQSVNMTGSLGMFSLPLGAGTRVDGGSHTFSQVFTNGATLTGLTCADGSTSYTAGATEDRSLSVSFNDAGTVVNLSAMAIKSVPFALQAHEVDGWGLNNLVKVSSIGSPTTFTTSEMANVKSVGAAACATNEILKWNGSAWLCSTDVSAGSPSDATYASKGIFQADTDAATSGLSFSASGVLKVNFGTGANQIVKLDASSKLPAVNGSALTGLSVSQISSGTLSIAQGGTGASTKTAAFDALSPLTTKGDVIVFDGTNNIRLPAGSNGQVLTADSAQASGVKWAAVSSGSVTSVTAGTGLSGGTITSTGTLSVDAGTGANQIVQLDASSKLPAVDGSALTGLSTTQITSGTLPVSRGGTGASSFAANNLIGTNGTGTALQAVTCTQNQIISFDASGNYGCYNLSSIAGGTYFAQNGNSLGAAAVLGTNDNNSLSFETNNTTRMTVTATGNVGIGTASPWAKLDISATDSTVVARIVNTNSTSGRFPQFQAFNFMGSAGSGFAQFVAGNSRGDIGTPSALLSGDTVGGFVFTGASDAAYNTVDGAIIKAIATQNFSNTAGGSALTFSTTANDASAPTERLRIDQNGNVGIGITAPSTKLHLRNGGITLDGGQPSLVPTIYMNEGFPAGTSGSSISIQPWLNGNVTTLLGVDINAVNPSGFSVTNYTGLRVSAGGGVASGNNRGVEINSVAAGASNYALYSSALAQSYFAGDVGIGTSSPLYPLHVLKASAANDANTVVGWFQGGTDATLGPVGLDITVHPSATGSNRFVSISSGDNSALRPLILNMASTGFFGNVGIGTSSPGAPLDVKDEVRISGATSGYAGLKSPAVGPSVTWTLPTADGSAGQFLKTDGSGNLSWGMATAPGDATYAAKGIVEFNTDAATSGISLSSGVATVNSGTGANQIVKLDASSKLPAVDGSALKNLNVNNVSSGTLPVASGGTGASSYSANALIVANGTGSAFTSLTCSTGQIAKWSGTAWGCVADDQWLVDSNNNLKAGTNSLGAITTGTNNIGIGISSLANTTASKYNVAIGEESQANMDIVSTGSPNISIGYQSLKGSATVASNTGESNVAIGYQALALNTTGNSNFAFGYQSLYNNSTGNNNFGVGAWSMLYNTTGSDNIAFGWQAATSLETGNDNIALGSSALSNNKLSSVNIAIGKQAQMNMQNGGGGGGNIAIGREAIKGSGTPASNGGAWNIGIGDWALQNLTSGDYNIAIGNNPLQNNSSGLDNVAIGDNVLVNNTVASRSVAIGYYAQSNMQAAGNANNIAIGTTALQGSGTVASNTGTQNIAVGQSAIQLITSGTGNVGMGDSALGVLTSGSQNVGFGLNAGYPHAANGVTTGSNNTFLGAHSGFGSTTQLSYATAVGSDAAVTSSNTVILGRASDQVAIGQTAAQSTYKFYVKTDATNTSIGGSAAWTNTSDGRFKTNVEPIHDALDLIGHLQGVRFDWDHKKYPGQFEKGRQIGFIAQQIEPYVPEIVRTDENGYKGVQYSQLVAVLTEAVKDLYHKFLATTGQQDRRIASLEEAKQQLESENQNLKLKNEELEKRLERIEKQLGVPAK